MDRSIWMYQIERASIEYFDHLSIFLNVSEDDRVKKGKSKIHCPCKKCLNWTCYPDLKTIKSHLIENGFMKRYTCWDFHGEVKTKSNTSVSNGDVEYNNDSNDNNHEHVDEMLHNLDGNVAKKNHDQSEQLFVDSETPLYEGCEDFTKLSATYRLMNVKAIHGWSDTGFTSLLEALHEMFPKAKLPISTYQAKKMICPMGFEIEKIDACPKDCMLYRDNDKDLHACRICGKSRYKRKKDTPLNLDVTKNGPPAKILWYLPIIPRLKRLFSNEKDAKLLRWHAEERKKDGKLRHVADSLQWRNIDNEFKEFGDEIRNIRFGLSSDGINPFGSMSSRHSTWPVLLCIYNLPPWLCMKRKYIMMSLLIQGPKQPGNDIDIYLKPLIKDMQDLWSKGVEVYDAYKKETFQMRAMIFCTISDFPAYGNLSGYKTKGKMACPVCQDHTHSIWLANCKKTIYMGHRRSLQENHPYRKKRKLFDNNIEVEKLPPPLNGHATFSQVEDINIVFGKGKEGTSTSKESIWKKKSVFWDLPYWKHLPVRHCLDVMHIEKNVCESLIGLLLNIPGKTKDEALKEEVLNITCDRTRNWILARITSPNMEELFRKLVAVDKKMAQGQIPKEKGADPLIVVLGPEHGGRTRTVGNGIGFRKGVKGYKQIKRRNQGIEEIEAIVDRKLAQRDAERDKKRDAERDAARDAERDAKRDAVRDAAKDAEIEVERDVEREASNDGREQKRQKQSSCESTTVVHKENLKDIKEPKSCMLFSPYTEDSFAIARGMVYPIGNGTIHGEPLIPYYMKVSVDTFDAAFGDTKLPVLSKADDTITMLKQSVGSFLQWPRCRILRYSKNTPTSKDSQRATLQRTLATHIPVAQETTPLMSTLQTPTLLETQQTEAPSALEDASKAKKELEKKLDDFEHVVFRKQPCVKAAYVRWAARDDDIADHIFEVPGGMIVGHENTFHVTISTEEIMKLWNLDGLNSSILLSFEWGLCKMWHSRNDNRCGFLNPYSIEGSLCLQPGSAVKDYLTHSLSVSNYEFMLAPYAQEDHWVLFVICPKQRMGYILDSKNKKQSKTERSYWLTSYLQDAIGSFTWTMPKCNQQQDDSNSGYYVMRWMYDFVNTYQLHFPTTMPWTNRSKLVEKDIHRTVEQWHAMCPI